MTTSLHQHVYRLPPPNGPFAVAVCACGETQRRQNAWPGDYSPAELERLLHRSVPKRVPQMRPRDTEQRVY